MKSIYVLIAILLCTSVMSAQVTVFPKRIDYGEVSQGTDRVVDIIIENRKDNKDFLLRIEHSHELDILYTSKELLPDSSITVRVKLNPRSTGQFSEDLKLHFGSLPVPVVVPITADVLFLDPADNIPCPSFSQRAADCCPSNMFVIEVYDALSGDPIGKATVTISQLDKMVKKTETFPNGGVTQSLPIAYYSILVEKKGYRPQTQYSYINNRNNRFRFELERDETFTEEVKPVPADTLPAESDALPESLYKPNNIVFLLDVSTSMAQGNKMELLRMSLDQLTGILRPVDLVALMTYADNASLLLPSTSGDQKSDIMKITSELKAYGNTAGAEGFRNAFRILKEARIEGGNNQLIVITDGAFGSRDEETIRKHVRKSAAKGYITSIVSIKGSNYARENLREIADLGKGSFMVVETESDAGSALIEEIKKQSLRK